MSIAPARKTSNIIWNILKIILALALVGFVLSRTDLDSFVLTIRSVSVPWLVIAATAFVTLTLLKALQYYFLVGEGVSYPQVLSVVVVQNAVSNFLASSAGIASYLASLRVEHGVKISRSLIIFLLTKIGDLVSIWLMLMVSSFLVWSQIAVLQIPVIIMLTGIGAVLFIFFLTILYRQRFTHVVDLVLGWMRLSQIGIFARGLELLRSLAEIDFRKILRKFLITFVISFFYLCVTILVLYANFQVFNIDTTITVVIFVTILNQLVSYFPIQVFGGLGVWETSLLYFFGVFGIPHETLAPALIGMRILSYPLNLIPLIYLPIYSFFLNREKKAQG